MTDQNDLTFAEFFAGIGLMRVGLERAGWRIAFANDIDEDKWRMYRDNFSDTGEFVLGDVHQLDVTNVPSVVLATASFPCNDLSLAGSRKGLAGVQSSAFWGFVEVLKRLGRRRPVMVLLENVTGFLSSHDGNDFRDALLALNELGYAVDSFIIDAVRFVPQTCLNGARISLINSPLLASQTLVPKGASRSLLKRKPRWPSLSATSSSKNRL
jgi:DNA (cytosine-5)-methyltransferase 1